MIGGRLPAVATSIAVLPPPGLISAPMNHPQRPNLPTRNSQKETKRRSALIAGNGTSWADLAMSVDWGRPEAVGGASNRRFLTLTRHAVHLGRIQGVVGIAKFSAPHLSCKPAWGDQCNRLRSARKARHLRVHIALGTGKRLSNRRRGSWNTRIESRAPDCLKTPCLP
jgi:hypothetical protein